VAGNISLDSFFFLLRVIREEIMPGGKEDCEQEGESDAPAYWADPFGGEVPKPIRNGKKDCCPD